MSRYAAREWLPDERPTLPGSPSTLLRFAYSMVGFIGAITGGLGNALVSVNLLNLQGILGAYSPEVAWLPAAYVMTNVSTNLLQLRTSPRAAHVDLFRAQGGGWTDVVQTKVTREPFAALDRHKPRIVVD